MKQSMSKNKLIFVFFALLLLAGMGSGISSDKTMVFTIEREGIFIGGKSLAIYDSPFSEMSNLNKGIYRADLTDNDKVLYSVKFDFESLSMANPPEGCIDETGKIICNISLYGQEHTNSVILNFPFIESADAIKVYQNSSFMFEYGFGRSFKNKLLSGDFNYYIVIGVAVVVILAVLWVIVGRKKDSNITSPLQYLV